MATPGDQQGMYIAPTLVIVCLCIYGAYRIIGGGAMRPQSERLNNYGFVGHAVLLIFTASMAARLFFKARRLPPEQAGRSPCPASPPSPLTPAAALADSYSALSVKRP